MTEKELIGKIRELHQIKPNQDWVVLTKSQILRTEKPVFSPFAIFSPAKAYSCAGMVFVLLLVGIFGFAQHSLPGDFLYSIKKITERSQAVFISESEKPNFQLKLTSNRLEDLARIVEANQVSKLSSALKELSASKSEAKKEVVNSIKNKPEEAVEIAKKVAPELQEINEREDQVLASLGLEPVQEETGEPTEKTVIEVLIQDVENSSLTEEQENDLAKVKELYDNENYQGALEFYLTSSLNQ